MNASELKAAAENRVREIAYATGWSGDMRVNMTTVVGALRCAVKMLDEERAARLAADEQREREDAEPITEEWLRSFMDQEYEGTFSNRSMMLGCICEECGRYGWCWIIGNVHIVHLQTRGQLRKLLEALKGST